MRVVADQYPTIQVNEFKDSASENRLIYFVGNGNDDYGLSKLNFNYSIIHQDGKQSTPNVVPVTITNSNKTSFQYNWNTNEIDLKPGDQINKLLFWTLR